MYVSSFYNKVYLGYLYPADVGIYNIKLTIGLLDHPEVIPIVKNFVVTITCEVFTLTFYTLPAVKTTRIYTDSAVNLPFVMLQSPACGKTVTYTISPTKAFLSLQSPTSAGGSLRISGATISDIGTYAETLTATVDA